MIAADSARPTLGAWLLCAVLIAGCVTHGPLATLQPVAAPDSAARIVVVREARIVVQPVWQVVLDGRPVYGLGGGEHIVLPVNPGDRILGIRYLELYGWEDVTIALRAEARQTYYFRIGPSGAWSSRPAINAMTAEVGQALMAKTTRISP